MKIPNEINGHNTMECIAKLRESIAREEKAWQKSCPNEFAEGNHGYYGFLTQEDRLQNLVLALRAGDSFSARKKAWDSKESTPRRKDFDLCLKLFSSTFKNIKSMTDEDLIKAFECSVAVAFKDKFDEYEKSRKEEKENRIAYILGFLVLALMLFGAYKFVSYEYKDEYCDKYVKNYPGATYSDCERSKERMRDM